MIKPIDGFNSNYTVSDDGQVYSKRRQGQKGSVLQQRLNNNGYLRVSLTKNGKNKAYFVHRLVALTFVPNPENKGFVNHIDGNKTNNNASNLEWCTRSENMRHAVKNGLAKCNAKCGERHPQCKIDDKTAIEIIKLHRSGVQSHVLAKQFKVTGTTIRNIVYGRRKFCSKLLPESWMITDEVNV